MLYNLKMRTHKAQEKKKTKNPSIKTKPNQQQQNKEAKNQTPKFNTGLQKKKKKKKKRKKGYLRTSCRF